MQLAAVMLEYRLGKIPFRAGVSSCGASVTVLPAEGERHDDQRVVYGSKMSGE